MSDDSEDAHSGGELPAREGRPVAVRYQPGVVGESRRQAHLALTEPGTEGVAYWTTACGQVIPAELAEVADRPWGMPCLRCLVGMPESACPAGAGE